METLGAPELIIILIIVVLLFGSAKLPKLARSIGEASREFKRGVHEGVKDEPSAEKSETSNASTNAAQVAALNPKITVDSPE